MNITCLHTYLHFEGEKWQHLPPLHSPPFSEQHLKAFMGHVFWIFLNESLHQSIAVVQSYVDLYLLYCNIFLNVLLYCIDLYIVTMFLINKQKRQTTNKCQMSTCMHD